MAKKVSLINMKGGVGKSTLTTNLGWYFASYTHWLKKVLVIDLDPQFNASQYLLSARKYKKLISDNGITVSDIFEQNNPLNPKKIDVKKTSVVTNVVEFRGGSRLDVIPSRLELSYSLQNPAEKHELLSKLVKSIEHDYDLILLDCAPTESFLTTAAYLSSDYILVPVKPEYLSSIGLPLLVNSMNNFKKRYEDHNLELAGVVFNATSDYSPEEDKAKSEVRDIARKNKWYIFDNEVRFSRSYPKGAREGKPISRTSYARRDKKWNFQYFADELGKRIKL